jgi:hypothetical protein
LDDADGLSEEHPQAPLNMGLTPLQLAVLLNDTHRYVQFAIETLIENGLYTWQALSIGDALPGELPAGWGRGALGLGLIRSTSLNDTSQKKQARTPQAAPRTWRRAAHPNGRRYQ